MIVTTPAFYDLGVMRQQREIAPDHVPAQGALPAWLRGALVRNGHAIEQSNVLILNIAACPDAGIVSAFYLRRPSDPAAQLPNDQVRRYRVPLKADGRATYATISDECVELPRYDRARLNTQPWRVSPHAMSNGSEHPHAQNDTPRYNRCARDEARQ